jgi:hypothetical protein
LGIWHHNAPETPILSKNSRSVEEHAKGALLPKQQRNSDELRTPSNPYIKENELNSSCIGKIRTGGAARHQRLGLLLALSVLALTSISSAQGRDTALSFQGGIGVVNVIGQNTDLTVKLNVVRGVTPAAPWVIGALTANITSDGHISVVGRGLLLSAGDGIGTNAGASVHATLFCGPATSPTASDEAGVPLDAAGNFQINDVLTPVPELPCESPVLLIRSGAAPGQGVWFAAGIPSSGPGPSGELGKPQGLAAYP